MTPRHPAIEFKRFLVGIDQAVPAELEVQVSCGNSSAPKTRRSGAGWSPSSVPAALHPTYSSWLNLVERWFAELTTKWLRRGRHARFPS
jgi:hypothetical protein